MAYGLDTTHEKVLEFLRKNSGRELTLMEIGNAVGLDHSQKVLNKLDQLEKKGYIRKNYELKTYDVLNEPIKDVIYIPMYGAAQCGNQGSNIIHESPSDMVGFNTSVFGIKNDQNYILVKAKGDSMNPEVQDGDLLLIHRQKNYLPQDKVLLVHQGKLKVKMILRSGNDIYLISSNGKHEPVQVLEEDNLDIIGIVTKIISNP